MKILRFKNWLFLFSLSLLFSCANEVTDQSSASAELLPVTNDIRINQIGYYPTAIKRGVVVVSNEQPTDFQVRNAAGEVALSGKLSGPERWELAGETVYVADFSELTAAGNYHLEVPKFGRSYEFRIDPQVLRSAFHGSIKGLYYQRMSMPLEERHAGKWHRVMAHPDDRVAFHPSSGRTEGYLDSPGGWYDAGDYNKYIVNAAFPMGQFLLLEEQYPNSVADNALNIPESGNGTSDYLDELRYELDWMLTMQDTDGGLFHKLTTKNFEGMVMPDAATSPRFVVGKGTTATLDFAAATAQASRVFRSVDAAFADQLLTAAERAYAWAVQHPAVAFKNPSDISTGEYGDDDFTDEWSWAATELWVTTQKPEYRKRMQSIEPDYAFRPGESWTEYMRFLGYFTLLNHADLLPNAERESLRAGIITSADVILAATRSLPYHQPIDDFHWGSNSDVLNAAMILLQAYRLTEQADYLNAARTSVDYIFGTNATGYSYLTGFGARPPMFIHHRQSAADGIADPVPGLLSGGPNSRRQDAKNGTVYPPDAAPMQSWVDQEPSYASNEICLNWNAPLTYVLGVLEQIE